MGTEKQRKVMAWTAALTTLCVCGTLFTGGFGNWGLFGNVMGIVVIIVPFIVTFFSKSCVKWYPTEVSIWVPAIGTMAFIPLTIWFAPTAAANHIYLVLVIPTGVLGFGFFLQFLFSAALDKHLFKCCGSQPGKFCLGWGILECYAPIQGR